MPKRHYFLIAKILMTFLALQSIDQILKPILGQMGVEQRPRNAIENACLSFVMLTRLMS